MKIKNGLLSLFCAFAIHLSSISQTNIVKAKILDAGTQEAEKNYNNGIANFEKKNFKGAISDYAKAIALKPDFEQAYYNSGIAKFEMKDKTGAIADFDKSISLTQNPESYFSRGQVKYA